MNRFSKFLRTLILVLATIVFLYMVIGLIQQYKSFVNSKERLKVEKERLLQKEKNIEQLLQFQKEASRLDEQLLFLENALPDKPLEDSLIEIIEGSLSNSKSSILEIRFDNRNQLAEYTQIPIRVIFEGSYSDLIYYLYNLTSSKRLLRVEKIQISKENNGLPSQIQANISLNAFYVTSN